MEILERAKKQINDTCDVDGCNEPAICIYNQKAYCLKHRIKQTKIRKKDV